MNHPNPFPVPIAMDRDELDRQFDQLRSSALLGDGQTVTLQSQLDLGATRVITELLGSLDDDALPNQTGQHDYCAKSPEAQFSLAPGHRPHVSSPRSQGLTRSRRPATPPPRMTALLVDDEPVERQVCRRMLEHAGYDVLEAADMPEALATLAQRGPVDVVVSDVQKAMDGEWSL
jgi:Response regulator receiver domain